MHWSGEIAEWKLRGVSSAIEELSPSPSGREVTKTPIGFHVTRRPGYYFWKALLPLYLLSALSMTTPFHFETDDLEARSSIVSTYFLATFAMLYVVDATLPKTHFLTWIDIVIVVSTVSLALTGIATLTLAKVHAELGKATAERWNWIAEVGICALYGLLNVVILLPPYLKQRSAIKQLKRGHRNRSSDAKLTASDEENPMISGGESRGAVLPTVCEGHDYITVGDLKSTEQRDDWPTMVERDSIATATRPSESA
jgi:hypothetical protein